MRFISRRLLVMFAAFIMLGLPEGVLGTAWPSIRSSFDRPESALAQLIIAYTVGYLLSTLVMGRLVERLGMDPTIRLGVLLTATGLAAYALSPVWLIVLAAGWLLGTGAGVVDASVNAEVALRHGQRTMNLLHAAFGVGATLGPLFITALLALNASWRLAYFVLLGIEVIILASLAPGGSARSDEAGDDSAASYGQLVRRPGLVLASTLVYFAVYVGSEITVGQWSFSVLTEERGIGETAAGFAVAAYWGGLTVGRLALGALGSRLHPLTLLRGSGTAALIAVVWFLADTTGSLIALPILGLAFAGVFPALVLMTSSWLPADVVTKAVGWQLAASSAGAIVSQAAIGRVVDTGGLNNAVTAMAVMVGLLVVAHLGTEAATRL